MYVDEDLADILHSKLIMIRLAVKAQHASRNVSDASLQSKVLSDKFMAECPADIYQWLFDMSAL